jgi:predicted ATPase
VQDAAYGTLLKMRRQDLHGKIARILEDRFASTAQPELVANHYERAGLVHQAIDCWDKAGQLAVWRSAMPEAVADFTKALELLRGSVDDTQNKRKELALQLSLAGALTVAKGWASPQMGYVYARACDLARELGEFSQLMAALFGLYTFRQNRAEIHVGRQVAEELLNFAKQHDDMDAKQVAHTSVGVNSLFQGEFANALMNMECYDPTRRRPSISIPSDPRVRCKSFTAWTLLLQGYPDRALVNSREALTYARELSNPYILAFALHVNCVFQQLRGDREALMTRSEELVAIATEQAFPHFVATGTFFRSWAWFMACGPTDEIIRDLHQALEAKRATGAEIKVPYYLGLLSKAHRSANGASTALSLLEDALDIVARTGERWFEAELHRLRGEALLKSFEPDHTEDSAEASFQHALEIASRQGGQLWALRAGNSIARLWRDQGKRQQAHELLAPVYGWFTEGFDTLDLKEAKALLDELA